MMKCVIVEDEPQSAERLMTLLERFHSHQVTVEKWLKSPVEVLDYLGKNSPDLVFFDVEIKDQTAFDLMGQLAKIDFKVIFTTAHQEYALQAIKVSALDYLLKPVDAEELALALGKLKKISIEEENKSIVSLIRELKRSTKLPEKLALPSIHGTEFIPVAELVRCQADVNYTHFFLKDGRKITVAKTLKEYENQLRDHHFFRVHNSHLVNLKEVRYYQKGKGGYLTLSDGTEIEVASRRKEELLQMLGHI
jgi:two-component system LytT family response regulator